MLLERFHYVLCNPPLFLLQRFDRVVHSNVYWVDLSPPQALEHLGISVSNPLLVGLYLVLSLTTRDHLFFDGAPLHLSQCPDLLCARLLLPIDLNVNDS